MIKKFLAESFKDVRSSKRTDVLHDAIIDSLTTMNPYMKDYKWEVEIGVEDGYQLPKENKRKKKFKIDIVGRCKKTNDVKICVLAKAMNSSIGKNFQNYTNTTIGEAARVMFSPEIARSVEKVLFVSFYPRVAPIFDKNGVVKGLERSAMNKPKIDHILNSQYNDVVRVVDVPYDIRNIESMSCVDDFYSIDIDNIEMEAMRIE
jgi:hypothetical protein